MKKYLRYLVLIVLFLLVGCSGFIDYSDTNQQSTTTTKDSVTSKPTIDPEETTEEQTTEEEISHEDEGNLELPHDLIIHVIDVGQGDATFIVLPNNETVLIDAGTRGAGDDVVDYLNTLGITTIDYVVGTHPDADHIGGLIKVIPAFDVKNIYLPDKTHTSQTFQDLLLAIADKGLEFDVGETGVVMVVTDVDGRTLKLEIISPHPDRVDGYDNNNASIVIMMTYGERRFLLMGDAEERVENDLLNDGINLKADVLKVGHHGSNTSTSDAFLEVVDPEIAFISAGVNNRYGHPHDDIIEKLEARGIEIYRTDELGTFILTSNGIDIIFHGDELPTPEPGEPDPMEPGYIVMNEMMPNPESGENEWIELYNPTDQTIDIGGFYIIDIANNKVTIPERTTIAAHGYYVIHMSRAILNDTGDTVYLYDVEENLLDEFTYENTVKGKAFYRLPDGGDWVETPGEPTPGASNIQTQLHLFIFNRPHAWSIFYE